MAFGDDSKDVTQIKEWYNQFKDGPTSGDSDRPSTSQNDQSHGDADGGFGHEVSGGEIRAYAADGGADIFGEKPESCGSPDSLRS